MSKRILAPKSIYNPDISIADGISGGFVDTLVSVTKRDTVPIMDATVEFLKYGGQPVDQNFDLASNVRSDPFLEANITHLAHARNQDHFNFLAQSLRDNQERRESLDRAGMLTSFAAEMFNPINLIFAVPYVGPAARASVGAGTLLQAGKAGFKAGLYSGVAVEAIRYPFDQLETGTEAVTNIAGSAVFGGVLGAGIPYAIKTALSANTRIRNRFPYLMEKAERELEIHEREGVDFGDVKIVETSDDGVPTGPSVDSEEDVITIFTSTGTPYRARVIERSDSSGSVKVQDLDGNEVIVDQSSSATTVDPFSPEYTVRSANVGKKGTKIADLSQEEIIALIKSIAPRLGSAPGQLIEIDWELDLTALRSRLDESFDLDGVTINPKKQPEPDEGFSETGPTGEKPTVSPTERVRLEKKEVIDPETGEITIEKTFTINRKQVAKEFADGSYATSAVAGGRGLGKDIESQEIYIDFLYNKEKNRIDHPQKADELDVDYEARINTYAESDTASGYGLKETPFTKYHIAGSPVFNLLRDEGLPDGIKRLLSLQTGNNQIALKRNTAGFGTNAVDQQMGYFTGMFRDFALKVDNHWALEVKGREPIRSRTLNASYDDLIFVPNNREEWFKSELDLYIDINSGGKKVELSKNQQNLHRDIKAFFKDFLALSQDEGMLMGITHYENAIAQRRKSIALRENVRDTMDRTKPGSEAKIAEIDAEIDELMNGPNGVKDLEEALYSARAEGEYLLPRFYNILELKKRGDMYHNFVRVLEAEYEKNPITGKINDEGRFVPHESNPREDAIATVNRIINDENEPVQYVKGSMKQKHLKRRALHLPDAVLKPFLVKDLNVFARYAQNQGHNIAWRKNFGEKSLQNVLDEIVLIGEKDGVSPDLIRKSLLAFKGDYLRNNGSHRGSPHRWDNQVAQVATSLSAWTRLPASGVTAFADMSNMAAARSVRGMVRDMVSDFDAMRSQIQDIETFGEVLSYHPDMIKEQLMGEAITGLQPTMADRITHYPDKLWFNTPLIGNDLLGITTATRRLAATYNTSDIVRTVLKSIDKTITNAELQQLGELGLNPTVLKKVAKELVLHHKVSESGRVFFANTKDWDMTSKSAREAHQALSQAIDLATDAHVIFAKNFDKPRIVDGFAYVRYHPLMKVLGAKPDEGVTYQGAQYVRIGSGLLKFPFQFMNYIFGATNAVLGRSFDPAKERRLQHITASLAASTALLFFTKPFLFGEDRDMEEIAARVVERSGIIGVYGDLIYEGLHSAQALGVDKDQLPIPGKFKTSSENLYDPLIGPAGSQLRDLAIAARDYTQNNSSRHARALSRNLPYLHVGGIDIAFEDLHDLLAK